ncbi:MAG: DMT family transporter [Paracoccus sp. (in: a-proteobacteria)]|uniref:DMT family transporter n=1 Tax=Paracoccus sp. TaxID=267 RepID=UPI0026DF8334|nr:DMT family transporter [Paracoccus sp. (in: a-proteobacteria)]MDO5612838.1 DMT family transporter [Paracoccus sp. (in: a-proteobacteria)]
MQDQGNTRRDLIGIGWMVATGLSFVAVSGIVRALDGALPAAQAAFIRFCFGIVFLGPALAPALRAGFSASVWQLFGLRGALHVAAVLAWFYAMSRIPVAEVTAIGYLNPVVVTVGAALFMGERISTRRIAAIAVAVLGAVIVLRPGIRTLDPGHLAQIAAAVCFGTSYLVAKRLSLLASPAVVVAMLSLTVTVGLAPLAAVVWVPPTLMQVVGLGLVAVFATLGHYTMARAFAAAPLTVTQPVTFLQLIWAALLGWFVFHEPLDGWVIFGGALMIGAITYITWRESRGRGRVVTPPAGVTKG